MSKYSESQLMHMLRSIPPEQLHCPDDCPKHQHFKTTRSVTVECPECGADVEIRV